jgi:hypothetical protein
MVMEAMINMGVMVAAAVCRQCPALYQLWRLEPAGDDGSDWHPAEYFTAGRTDRGKTGEDV